eukprot:231844-Pyramimonas_sp.AAC.1
MDSGHTTSIVVLSFGVMNSRHEYKSCSHFPIFFTFSSQCSRAHVSNPGACLDIVVHASHLGVPHLFGFVLATDNDFGKDGSNGNDKVPMAIAEALKVCKGTVHTLWMRNQSHYGGECKLSPWWA